MFSAFKNKKQLIGFIGNRQDGFLLYVIDSISEKTIWTKYYEKENAKNFMDKFANFSNFGENIFKCFIIELFGMDFRGSGYPSCFHFCDDLKAKLHQFQIPYYCVSLQNFLFSLLLASTKTISKFRDTVLLVIPFKTHLHVGEFKYTKKGYKLVQKKFFLFNPKTKPDILRQKIFGTSTPKKLIVAPDGCKKFTYRKIFKEMPVYAAAHGCLCCHPEKFVIEECKWILDKNYVKYHILPTSICSFNIVGSYGCDSAKFELLKVNMDEPLPISKTAYFSKSVLEVLVNIKSDYDSGSLKSEVGKNYHKVKITLTIDQNNLYEIHQEGLHLPNFESFPSRYQVLAKLKIPFIGFFDNSSVVAVHKESDGYIFLEKWNEKPQFGLDALNTIKRKHSFVVFDLIKIMSMPSDSIEESSHWGFTFTKDAENPVLLQFNTFSGKRMAASPAFLLAMLLDQQMKAIKKETRERPTKIAFWIFKEYDDEGMKRIKAGIEEACQLKKVECIFIDAPEYNNLY
uniref:Uncharacterized protein n=2 Tax=Panagrolaimus sp. PS1159 TaxID=55785 RepID=A0AC35FBL8_9BILA